MRKLIVSLLLLQASATGSAFAAFPRLAHNDADYLLMPLCAYVAIIVSARGGQLIKRRLLRRHD